MVAPLAPAAAAWGAAAGSTVAGPAGTIPGAVAGVAALEGFGGAAFPAFMRHSLMDAYEKGSVTDFKDFWARSSAVFIETVKEGGIGALTLGVGGTVAKGMSKMKVAAPIKTTARLTSEILTMTSVGAALDGKVPDPSNFAEAAIVVFGLHGAFKGAGKLREIYKKTGLHPAQVALRAKEDPVLQGELLADTDGIPKSLEPLVDPDSAALDGTPVWKSKIEETIASLKEDTLVHLKEMMDENNAAKVAEILGVDERSAMRFIEDEGGSFGWGEKPPAEKLTPEQEKIVSSIGEEKKTGTIQKAKDYIRERAYEDAVDDLDPLLQGEKSINDGKPLKIEDSVYVSARLTRGIPGIVKHFFEKGTLRSDGTVRGKPLREVLKPIEKDKQGFRSYIMAKRALRLLERGIDWKKTGIKATVEDAKKVVAEFAEKFEPVRKELEEYRNATIDYMVEAGVISKESAEAFRATNEDYIPFYRIVEEEAARGPGKGLKVHNPIRQLKGSELLLVDPIESIIRDTRTFIELAERNKVALEFIRSAEGREGGFELAKRVEKPIKKVEVGPEEMQKYLDEFGIDGQANSIPLTVFRSEKIQLADNHIQVFENGKRVVYEVSEGVARAMRALDRESVSVWAKIQAPFAAALRAGATMMPDFMLRNAIRDQFSASTLSKGYIPFANMVDGFFSRIRKDQHYWDWQKSGGAAAEMVAMDRDYISKNVWKLDDKTGFMSRTWNVVKSPLELLQVGSEIIENSTRLGEYKRVAKGSSDPKVRKKAAYISREATLDFARVGAKTRAWNMITAFFNAQVQGLDRTARAAKEDPAGFAARTAAAITLPSVLLWWANKDDKRVQNLPRWQKDLFWIIPVDKWEDADERDALAAPEYLRRQEGGKWQINRGNIYRVPKPFEVGLIFGSVVERGLDLALKEDPRAFKDFGDSLLEAFTPSIMPTGLSPVVEQVTNHSFFRDRPLMPGHLEGIAPEYQYNEYTSETGKILGQFVGAIGLGDIGPDDAKLRSPIVVENYIRAWTGTSGGYALQLADMLLTKAKVVEDVPRATKPLADYPIIKAFMIRYPSANLNNIQDFDEKYRANQRMIETVEHLRNTGDFKNWQKVLTLEANRDKLYSLKGVHEALGKQRHFISLVDRNPDIPQKDKDRIIEGAYFAMINIADFGNQLIDHMDKALKAKEPK
jgi:hypothetical protein